MEDLDPAAGVVEVEVGATAFTWDPGTGVPLDGGLAFNGQVPGPLLEANLGDEVVVHLANNSDLDISLHWHGFRVPPEVDGIQQMRGDPVSPGESCEYRFVVVDAGTYWFHTHMDTAGEPYMVVVEATGDPGASSRLMNRRFVLHEEDGHMVEFDPMGDGENPVATFVYGPDETAGTPWIQPEPELPSWGAPVGNLGHHWVLDEDMMGGTVTDVPPRSTVTVVSALDNPGEWMSHGHVLEYADDGMAEMRMVME